MKQDCDHFSDANCRKNPRMLSSCPIPAQLEDLIAGRLAIESHRTLEEHALACQACQTVIDEIDEPQDTFLATLHDVIGPAAARAAMPFQRALSHLRSLCDGPLSNQSPESQWPNPIGNLSDFRIIAEIGRGGMGIVYEVEQLSLNRRVALKILPFAALVSPRQLQRFQNEARAAASLEHPHIVPVYGAGAERGVHYIAMQLIDGRNLAQIVDRLREPARAAAAQNSTRSVHFDQTHAERSELQDLLARRAPQDPAYRTAIVRIGIQAAVALEYARQRGIIHRDIKPSNLMLDQSGKLWVTDFGLARIETNPSMSQTGAVVGTLRYMSPEQILDDRSAVDHRSDIYSLGATLYELLTLTPVFADAAEASLRSRIATDEPWAPRQLNPRIPADLETIVLKAMSKDRAERYATAGEFAADLQRFLEGKPICARAIGPVRRSLKWARRRPAVAALIAVSALALAALFGGGWWHAASLQVALNASDKLRIAADQQRQTAIEQEAIAQTHSLRVRQFLYAADMKLAYAAWKNGHVAEVLELLARHEPRDGREDLRTFVWHYLWRLSHSELLTLRGHTDDVHCVAFSPDGGRLATASHDGTAKLWDLSDGRELATFLEGHTDQLNAVAFSPDGKTLATGSDDRLLRLWKVASGQELAALAGHSDDVNTVAFSPDGMILASGGADHLVKLWDPSTGIELATLAEHSGGVESLAFSPDGTTLASASSDLTTILWDLDAKQPRTALAGHDDFLRSVAFAHSRPIIATGSDDRSAKLWHGATGRLITTLRGHDEIVRSVVFSPDDRTLAVAVKDGSLWLWDVEQERAQRTIRGHTGRLWHVAFSPDGRTLATASGDRTVKIWDAQAGRQGRIAWGLPAPVSALAFSPDGRQLVATAPEMGPSGSCLLVVDLAAGVERRVVHAPGQGFDIAAFSHDGTSLAMVGPWRHPVHKTLIRAAADQWQYESVALASNLTLGHARSFAISPDHRTMAAGVHHEQTVLWDVATGNERRRIATLPNLLTMSIRFSPDGQTLATGRQDGLGQLWDVATGNELATLRGHAAQINQFVFSPDGGMLATASSDRTLKLWDVSTGAEQATFQGHAGPVSAVAFSPDGKTLASSGNDGAVRLWDLVTRQELIALEGHQGTMHAVAFSPDGKRLASGGAAPDGQGEIFLWPPGGEARE
jgi:WD40 repeat protein/serine/threonine protein kinase